MINDEFANLKKWIAGVMDYWSGLRIGVLD